MTMTTERKHIHLIGICGTAMASLAGMLKQRSFKVTGSDAAAYPPMSDFLASLGIPIYQPFGQANLQPRPDLVVVGNAISRGNIELEHILDEHIPFCSLPQILHDEFLRDKEVIVVAGTHGKTTTTSMIAWVLHFAGFRPNCLIGGIAENFRSSYRMEGGAPFVVEGDEYDSAFFDKGPKFMHYLPNVAIVGNIEFDHADIYPNLDAIRLQFSRFINLIPERGYLAVGADSPVALEVCRKTYCLSETFGLSPDNDWGTRDTAMEGGKLSFDVLYRKKLFRRLRLDLVGVYNVRNALAATAVLHRLGVPEDDIRDGLEAFLGVRRRLQLLAEVDGIRIYEDFAHHPTAVRETLQALRDAFHPKRLWAIYEPRSATSRRNFFQKEIAQALSVADCVAVPALFRPEKVPDGERLDLAQLIADLRQTGRAAWNLDSVEGIIQKVCEEARAGDWIVILSNGGFGGIFEKLPAALAAR